MRSMPPLHSIASIVLLGVSAPTLWGAELPRKLVQVSHAVQLFLGQIVHHAARHQPTHKPRPELQSDATRLPSFTDLHF